MKYILLGFSFVFWSFILNAQNPEITALRLSLTRCKEDTNKVNTLNSLGLKLSFSNPDTSMILSSEALLLSKKISWKKGEANAERLAGWVCFLKNDYVLALIHYNNAISICEVLIQSTDKSISRSGKEIKGRALGNRASIYKAQSNYPMAIENYDAGLKISKEIGDKHGVGKTLGNMALLYMEQSAYPKAIDLYFESLKIAEEIGDKQSVGNAYTNISGVYYRQKDYTKAIDYLTKGLKIAEEIGDKLMLRGIYSNFSNFYKAQKNYIKAMEYSLKTLNLAEEMDDRNLIGTAYSTMANIYDDQKIYQKALEYHLKCLKIKEELVDKYGIAIAMGNIADVNVEMRKYGEAENYLNKGIILSREIGALDLEKFHEELFSILYEQSNKPTEALKHYKRFIALRDTIFSRDNRDNLIRAEMNYAFEKQEAVKKVEHKNELENQEAFAEEQNQRQRIIIWSVVIGLLLLVVFLVFILRSLRVLKRQKRLIELQKVLVEQKQTEIIDSIHYAKRIQTALLPNENYIQKSIKRLNKSGFKP